MATDNFRLKRRGFLWRSVRLEASHPLTPTDFYTVAKTLSQKARTARKIGMVAVRRSLERERIETRWNGKESEITAEIGDWIVTTLSPTAKVMRDKEGNINTYAIKPDKFADLYEPADAKTDFGSVYRPKGTVRAVFLSGGFEIAAPWGETQHAPIGYLLLNGTDVYGNNQETFEETYEFVE